jgi:hypothetical protein
LKLVIDLYVAAAGTGTKTVMVLGTWIPENRVD